MARLTGKAAIVTGAARGLGAAAATALCAEGAAVMITDVLAEIGEATAAGLRTAGYQAEFTELDVRDAASWQATVQRTLDRFGRLDCLVNNAGINFVRTIETATVDEFRAILDVNLIGPFLGMQAVIPVMKAKGGSIVNIASNSTRKVVALTTIYGATKAGLANLTKTAAVHCASSGYGIRINSVHPGPHETEMLLGGISQAVDIPEVRRMMEMIPMSRMGKPSEVGTVVAFLASDDASYMTGAEIFVDGGITVV